MRVVSALTTIYISKRRAAPGVTFRDGIPAPADSVRERAFSFCAIAFLGRQWRAFHGLVVTDVLLRSIVHFGRRLVTTSAAFTRHRYQTVVGFQIRLHKLLHKNAMQAVRLRPSGFGPTTFGRHHALTSVQGLHLIVVWRLSGTAREYWVDRIAAMGRDAVVSG